MTFRLLVIAVIVLAVTACNTHSHDHDKAHDHEGDEHEKVQYTVYADAYELFAEADPFIAGEQANVLAHFTKIPSFKPLDSVDVTAVLSVNGKEVKQTSHKPARKGIYSFNLTPLTTGTGTLFFYINTAVIEVRGVKVYSDHDEYYKHKVHEGHSMLDKVVFTKEQSWKIDFKTETVKTQALGLIIKTVAKIQPNNANESVIVAKAGGIVSFSKNNILEGKDVVSGEILFAITPGGMSENNISVIIAEAGNNFLKAEADYNRKKELAEDKIISKKEVLDAQTSYENAKAVYENLAGNFSAKGQSVISPLSGFVKQVFVNNGQYVEPGQALITVSQSKSLILNAYVQQQYSSILPNIHSATIKSSNDNKIFTFEELNGRVLSFGKSVNDDNFLIPVNLQIDNKAGLIQGSLVEVYLKTLSGSHSLVVPNTSIMEEQGNYFVFVQETPELFEKRLLKIGVTDGIYTEILSGLEKGERIVSKGAMLIKLAQASGALDPHSGHVH